MSRSRALAIVLGLVGCSVNKAITVDLPPERAEECKRNCEKLGMRLGAVVLMMNSAGCVCEPIQPDSPASPAAPNTSGAPPAASHKVGGRSAILAGAVVIEAMRQAEEENSSSPQGQQQQQQPSTPYTPPGTR
jgi:hypothetical protein